MTADIFSLKLCPSGRDICQICFSIDDLTQRHAANREIMQKMCVSCAARLMNEEIKNGQKMQLNIGGKIFDVGHVIPGPKPFEILIYERVRAS